MYEEFPGNSSNGSGGEVPFGNREKDRSRTIRFLRFLMCNLLACPLYRAAGLKTPLSIDQIVETSRELLPTYRPGGELSPYIGETLVELRHGVDVVLNVAPNGCMVSTMGEVLTPSIMHADGVESGRIQTLLSAEGDVDEEALTLAIIKATGPQRYYQSHEQAGTGVLQK
jgi:predicted nucleotide-binding protein (sugar kinase/HSP70/actin superfamily)